MLVDNCPVVFSEASSRMLSRTSKYNGSVRTGGQQAGVDTQDYVQRGQGL
jgi:hypothetical protein